MTEPRHVPAQVFHPSEYIAEEATARGWTIWDVAGRMGGDPAKSVLALQLYALCEPGCHLGDGRDLERAFGVRAALWVSLEDCWRAHPEARSAIGGRFFEWFEIVTEGNPTYWVRQCTDHFHVVCADVDLIGGRFETREEAEACAATLNSDPSDSSALCGTDARTDR